MGCRMCRCLFRSLCRRLDSKSQGWATAQRRGISCQHRDEVYRVSISQRRGISCQHITETRYIVPAYHRDEVYRASISPYCDATMLYRDFTISVCYLDLSILFLFQFLPVAEQSHAAARDTAHPEFPQDREPHHMQQQHQYYSDRGA